MSGWQPIETVPLGEEVLTFGGKMLMSGWPAGRRVVVIDELEDIYGKDGQLRSTAPTHWHALPTPPEDPAP